MPRGRQVPTPRTLVEALANYCNCKDKPRKGRNYTCYIYLNLYCDMHFHGKAPRICSLAGLRDYMKHVAVLWRLLTLRLVGHARTLTPAAIIGRLTECLPTLRGGISELSSLCSRNVIAHSEAAQLSKT